jgi:hypothetical protein
MPPSITDAYHKRDVAQRNRESADEFISKLGYPSALKTIGDTLCHWPEA